MTVIAVLHRVGEDKVETCGIYSASNTDAYDAAAVFAALRTEGTIVLEEHVVHARKGRPSMRELKRIDCYGK